MVSPHKFDKFRSSDRKLQKRFDTEEMFRDFKSGGYNLDDTNVSGNRLISLILIIAMPAAGFAYAYSSATFKGQIIKSTRCTEICR